MNMVTDNVPAVGVGGLLGMVTIAQVNQYIAAVVGLVTIGYTLHKWAIGAMRGFKSERDDK